MISISQPVSGEDFIDRIDLLRKMHATYPIDNIALVGPRRIGKSSVAEQFLLTIKHENTVKFRFDVQGNMGTPGKFAVRLLRSFLSSFFKQSSNTVYPGLDEMEINPIILVDTADQINSGTLRNLSRFLVSYFPPSSENERAVMEKVLRFLDDFSSEMDIKTVVVLDEFQEIVDLNKYKGFRRGKILGFLQNIISGQKNVWYCFSGSAVRMMFDILEAPDSPFYGRVKRFDVEPFDKDSTETLVYRCTEKTVTSEALNQIYTLSNGHPFYAIIIISTSDRISGGNALISRQNVEEAFISELSRGNLNSHCNYLFESSLARMEKRGTLLKEILRELSDGEKSVTDLAHRVGRRTGNLSLPLRNLYLLDLIDKRDKKYHIADPILEIWLKTVYGHNEPKLDIIRRKISKTFAEYIATMSSEAGIYFESYMREVLQKFDGQEYSGITLPRFNSIQGVNTFDSSGKVFGKPSNIEIDAICRGEENWICEFKYRKKSVGEKEIKQFVRKRDFIAKKLGIKIHRMMYVAKSGFSEYALNSDVWCVSLKRLNELLAKLNMKKISFIRDQDDME